MHQARWRSKGEHGSFADPTFGRFLHSVMTEDVRHGRLRLWTLSVDGVTEAALVGFLDNGVLHYFQKGFNPAYAREDLGTAILALALRSCFDDPQIRVFDFMGGGAPYKDLWARNSQLAMSCEVNATAGARMHTAARRLVGFGVAFLRAVTPMSIREARRERRRAARLRKMPLPHATDTVTAGVPLDRRSSHGGMTVLFLLCLAVICDPQFIELVDWQ